MIKCDKIRKSIYAAANTVIRILLLLITAGLCLQSMFSTSFIGWVEREDGFRQERTLNIADHPLRHLLVFLLFTLLGALVYRIAVGFMKGRQEKDSAKLHPAPADGAISAGSRRYVSYALSIFVLLMGTVWVLATQLAPGSDPAKVFSIAMQWRRGDFSAYAEGGYLFRYPFQAGIILFYYLLSFLFGMDNYIGPQFVNVLALAAIYVLLEKLAALFWKKDKAVPVIVHVALIFWLPLAFYVTYLYGILPGMALSLGAVYCAAAYIDTGKYRYIFPACICMGLATVIKMNCLIYLIAIVCFLLYDALISVLAGCGIRQRASADPQDMAPDLMPGGKDNVEDGITGGSPAGSGKPWKRCRASLAMIALMGVCVAGCNKVTERYVEHLSGYQAGDGEAMLSWVVMGLQETPLGPGGYSGYIAEVFLRYEYDTEKIKEASAADIKKIVTRMSQNILDDGVVFFARKNAFQWNDPTFISLDRTKGRTPASDVPAYAVSLIEGRGSVGLSVILNYAQTLLLFGVLLYVLLHWHSRNLYELMGAVVFLGGYLFHFVWESSASYTIPYFVVLIPYAVKGLADWVRYAAVAPARIRVYGDVRTGIRAAIWPHRAVIACGIAGLALLLLFGRTGLFQKTIALDDGEAAHRQFYHEDEEYVGYLENRARQAHMAGIADGYYYLSPCLDRQVAVVEKDGKVTFVSIMTEASKESGAASSTGREKGGQVVMPVSDVQDIEHKILLNTREISGSKEDVGITMRFRSNEQVLAVSMEHDVTELTVYREDGMNLFYEPGGDVFYQWDFKSAEDGGYYITLNGMALTWRDGEVTLEESDRSEEQRWVLQ